MHSFRRIAFLTALAATTALSFTPAAHAQFNIFGLAGPETPAALGKQLNLPVSAQFMDTLANASHAGLAFKGDQEDGLLIPVSGPRPSSGRKAGLLYIGADFCPYCAAQRWGLMLTLLRFGKLGGLEYMLSTAHDVYANTPTVTFQHARYESRYVDFQAVETMNRAEQQLMTPDPLQMKIFTTFDAPPYVRFAESIPFVYLGGKYMLGNLLVEPGPLDGKNWQQIADELASPHSTLFQSVMPNVNLLTAAICQLDGEEPREVCAASGVIAASHELNRKRTDQNRAAGH